MNAQVDLAERRRTADQLLAMPDDGWRYELVQGELRRMAPSGYPHGRAAVRIGRLLDEYVEANGLGAAFGAETGFRLASGPDTVRAPDAAFVRAERLADLPENGFFPGAPDLAVEVLSPGDTRVGTAEKVRDWLAAGTRMVMLIDPARRVVEAHRPNRTRLRLGPGDVLDADDVVPGWRVPVSRLFPAGF